MSIVSRAVGQCYRHILKPFFFMQDPEVVHDRMITLGRRLGLLRFSQSIVSSIFHYDNVMLEQTLGGIHFKNPVGLAAGFDKNAQLTSILPHVGFGFEEVGSITARSYEGNPKPRLWRLPEHQSLRVYYGLKNDGAEAIHKRLTNVQFSFPVGISIAKTNHADTANIEVGIADYVFTYQLFQDLGSYFTINISCPNTCEASPVFAEPENFSRLMKVLQSLPKAKPVFVKLSPDLSSETITKLVSIAVEHGIDGFVCTNLTKQNVVQHDGRGGFSGKLVAEKSNAMVELVYRLTRGSKIIIGCGGIFSAEDAYAKIKSGANLIQLVTGMIYQGPQVIGDINRGLVMLLKQDGYSTIADAVGSGVN